MGVSGSPLSARLKNRQLRRAELPEATGSPWEPMLPPAPAGIHHTEALLAQLSLLTGSTSAAPVSHLQALPIQGFAEWSLQEAAAGCPCCPPQLQACCTAECQLHAKISSLYCSHMSRFPCKILDAFIASWPGHVMSVEVAAC